MKYLVTEIQSFPGGATSTPTYAYDSDKLGGQDAALRAATGKFHQILAAAASSEVPVHTAVIYTDKGAYVRGESFEHNTEANDE